MKKSFTVILILFIVMLVTIFAVSHKEMSNIHPKQNEFLTKTGVCPPFNLLDEDGNIINPVTGMNADKPYSPRQTCGKCHDYEKITQGYHFQQGKDEKASGTYAERIQWASTPGNYGGNWCSPAPLYAYLSLKENSSATEMDMTSFTFITNGCGTCHPGGGSMEFDRAGKRYDKFMEEAGFTAGGTNNFDGDYFKANWNRSGVAEADCNLCHLPEYDYKGRNAHLLKWNFKWMATAGSGFAKVEGSVKDSIEIKLTYDLSKFTADGKVGMHLVREPRNETCLNCHSKPQWKKRGASFIEFTDVHIAKGVKCVDCHVSGSMATDERIHGKEVHQFGKGDDPSGNVRNDLDNTMRTCKECHTTGYLNAPIAKHAWLPPLHLEKIACQSCHIPQRKVKSALVQVSDVFNPGTKISPPPKYTWTFYDQNLNYWNHYGELAQFTAKDQPTDPFLPQYALYKGQIFPVNAVHSAWPAIYTPEKPGLHQPRMKDIYDMWMAHKADNSVYPELASISDDNEDLIPELNRPEEIDGFISAITTCLKNKGYDLSGRKVVWVNNDRMYFSSTEFKTLPKEDWEASPYASVYKYSHDVFPAKAGLGANGCTDCHSFKSSFMFAQTLQYPFDENGKPLTEPQYKQLGISGFMAATGAIRESIVKPVFYFVLAAFVIYLLVSLFAQNLVKTGKMNQMQQQILVLISSAGILAAGIFAWFDGDLSAFMFPTRLFLDANHFIISAAVLIIGIWFYMNDKLTEKKIFKMNLLSSILLITIVAGVLMLVKLDFISVLTGLAYTVYDFSLVVILILNIFYLDKIFNTTASER
jgi:hypothetical protein